MESTTPHFNLAKNIKEQIKQHSLYEFELPLKQLDIKNNGNIIPFSFKEYLELVDATERIVRQDNKSQTPDNLPPILKRIITFTTKIFSIIEKYTFSSYSDCPIFNFIIF